jgi:hypothetical protein
MMFSSLEVLVMSVQPSLRQRFFLAGLAFVLFLVFGYFSDLILIRHRAWLVADDLILALAAAMVVFLYERERSRILSERLRVIRDMNSFVRNELQILYSCLGDVEKTRVSTIERSVERIDWALRELLPGTHVLPDQPAENAVERSNDRIERSA